MSDFWIEQGTPYLVFSQYCSYDDWQEILSCIAGEIMRSQQANSLSILDIGSGQGRNILDLMQMLFTRSRRRHVLDLVEPSIVARRVLKELMVPEEDGGFRRAVFTDVSQIGENVYNVVIFMHSTYYIPNIEKVIEGLYNKNLQSNGIILILALPEDSSFFLNNSALVLPGNSSEIKYILDDLGIGYASFYLESRLVLNESFLLSRLEFDQLYSFMTGSKITRDEFSKNLRTMTNGDAKNLNDELIVIKKQ